MPRYKPIFKETAIVTGGLRPSIKVRPTPNSGKVELTFRGIWRLKRDAEEAKKFYKSINSLARVIKKSDGYYVYAGRVGHIGNKLGRAGALTIYGK
jgi:hypothetical protein